MRFFFTALILISLFVIQGVALQSTTPQANAAQPTNFVGRWHVKFALMGNSERNLVFTAQNHGEGSFQLLDTGPDENPVPSPNAAAWSLTNGNLSFSGEAELPMGTCCREMGTLIFKSKLSSGNSISGKLIFVTNTEEDESPYKYHSTIGTFTASRLK